MKIIYIDSLNEIFNKDNLSIMLGSFDGMHKGHMALLKELLKIHKIHALLTFYPHPLSVIKNESFHYLDSVSDKEELLSDKLDYLIVLRTNKKIINSKKEEFINFLKINKVTDIVCGNDYTFGVNRSGTINDLKDFNLHIVNDVTLYKKRISSSLIRQLINEGEVNKVYKYLGRYYCIKGVVSHGAHLGNTIGFPTINIENDTYLNPKNGVYFGYTFIDNNKYYGMINVGINPTFNKLDKTRIEMNIFDFNDSLYDIEMPIYFLEKIRDEKKFNSKEELIKELKKNKEYCLSRISFYN